MIDNVVLKMITTRSKNSNFIFLQSLPALPESNKLRNGHFSDHGTSGQCLAE